MLAIYTLLSLLLTLPLVLRLTTHVPGDGIDDPALAWNLWWLKFSLIDRQINPFDSEWMFYPIGINLAFYTLTVLNGLLSIPLQTALQRHRRIQSGAAQFLRPQRLRRLSALSGGAAVGRRRHEAAGCGWSWKAPAFLGGLLYAFSSSKLFYASLGQFNIASSQWIPFAVLYTLRSVRPGARAA